MIEMIGKLIKGTDPRGLMAYLLGRRDSNNEIRPRVQLLGGTFAGETVDELASEFARLKALRPKLSKTVAHQCLRLPDTDPIPSDATWSQIAQTWVKEMGFEMYTAVCHGDHIHIAASRINTDGTVVSDSHDWKRSEAAVRKIEEQFGLTKVECSHLLEPEKATTHRKAPTQAQVQMHLKGEVPPSQILANLIEKKLEIGCTASELVEHLEQNGIKVRPNIASTGKVSGLAYEIDGIEVTAKALGRGFTWANLQKRGMTYEQDRDIQTLRSAGYRATPIGLTEPDEGAGRSDTTHQPVASGARRDAEQNRSTHLTSGSGSGRDSDLNEEEPSADQSNSERPRAREKGRGSVNISHSDTRSEARRDSVKATRKTPSTDTKRPAENGASVSPSGIDVDRDRELHDLVVLAVNAAKNAPAATSTLQHLKVHAASVVEKTKHAVTTFLDVVPASTYRLQLVRPGQANINLPEQSRSHVLKSIDWLKAQNVKGSDIYIRPEDRRYILVDDLAPSSIERMKKDGFHPCAVTETSKGNYQAWIRIADESAPEPSTGEATAIARALAKSYDGDMKAADYAHVGRLPGYTNRKPSRLVDGKSPFVLLREATSTVAKAGLEILNQARSYIAKITRQTAIKDADYIAPIGSREGDPATAYRALAHDLTNGKANADWSVLDFKVAQRMLLSEWSIEQVKHAIEQASPNIDERKGSSTSSYAARTAQKASQSDFVQQELQRRKEAEKLTQKARKPEDDDEDSYTPPSPKL